MAIIHHLIKTSDGWSKAVAHADSPAAYCVENIDEGEPFAVYIGPNPSAENDITNDIPAMLQEEGEFTLIEGVAGSVAIIAAVAAVAVVAVVALQPSVPDLAPPPVALSNVNRNEESPNNQLGARDNAARINERVPDVCGRVRSIPDVIMTPYRKFESLTEFEIGYYCVGRSDIEVTDIKDGDTLISNISGSSAAVYGPETSPNSGDPPITQIGEVITDEVAVISQSSEVDRLILKAPNEFRYEFGATEVTVNFVGGGSGPGYTDGSLTDTSGKYDFTTIFQVGDSVELENTGFTNINATGYEVQSVTVTVLTLRIAYEVNRHNQWVSESGNYITDGGRAILEDATERSFSDWFSVTNITPSSFWTNIVARNGLYKDDGSNRTPAEVDYQLEWQFLNPDGSPLGSMKTVNGTFRGSTSQEIGVTEQVDMGADSPFRVRVRRVTDKDFDFGGTVVDEIQWRDLFSSEPVGVDAFGDVTTIHTKRKRTIEAAAIKNPQLNCIATEMVSAYLGNGVFAGTKTTNTQAIQSLIRLALDPVVGRRSLADLDADAMLTVQTDIETYFGSADAGQFSYTFDSTDTTPQEVFYTICNAVFSVPIREGRVLGVTFEKPQTAPAMVFTHRSKRPKSELWGRQFQAEDRPDGVEFKYIDPATWTQETLFFPADRSAVNPKRYEIPGIANKAQAQWRTWREFQKLKFGKISVEFDATAEGRFVRPLDMISVVKGSRVLSADGYVTNVDGLTLTLSQEVTFTPGDDHYIVLKKRDGSTESILVTEGLTAFEVVLDSAPSEAPYTGDSELKTEFSIGNEARLDGQRVLASEIDPSRGQYVAIRATNYAPQFYEFDTNPPTGTPWSSGFSDGFGGGIAPTSSTTLDPESKGDEIGLFGGNLVAQNVTTVTGTTHGVIATVAMDSGLWYFEFRAFTRLINPNRVQVGVGPNTMDFELSAGGGSGSGFYGIAPTNRFIRVEDGVSITTPPYATSSPGQEAWTGVAFDADSGKMWYRNGESSWIGIDGGGTPDPVAGTNPIFSGLTGGGYFPACFIGEEIEDVYWVEYNFGSLPFQYSVPTGYRARFP